MNDQELKQILSLHKKWLNDVVEGAKANLRGADLQGANLLGADLQEANLLGANLPGADLRGANLQRAYLQRAYLRGANLQEANLLGANLRGADLQGANLLGADLQEANLLGADLREADLQGANLRGADLELANLRGVNLRDADLRGADLRDADLSQTKGLITPSEWLAKNFETIDDGLIVYKAVGNTPNRIDVPDAWIFEKGEYLKEVCHPDRALDCACGVNFGTFEWTKENIDKPYDVWKCLIEWRYMADVVVPYNTNGKARCGTLKLLEIIEGEE